ncbi:MAG: Flp pilus assembly protein CpaB [Candidatus Margulisiibacteriota bacterium]|jgi:pilus assembly protein CpaB
MVNKKFLILALFLAAITTFLVYSYMQSMQKQTKKMEEKRPVVTAKVNIPTKTIVTEEMLEIKQIPQQYVPGGVVSKLEDAKGKVLVINAMPGQMIFEKDLKEKEASLGLSFIIPPDKRAISVKVDSAAGISGMIKPGDTVDILVTLPEEDRTITVLQNVQVLAINQQTETKSQQNSAKDAGAAAIVTFALSLKDSEKVVLAANKGPLQLALRAAQDSSNVNSMGASVGTILPRDGTPAAPVAKAVARPQPVQSNSSTVKIIKGSTETQKEVGK